MRLHEITGITEGTSRTVEVIPELGKTPSEVVMWFKEGACYSLALEHNRRYGWPIYVVGIPQEEAGRFESYHSFVLYKSILAVDIVGFRNPRRLLRSFVSREEIEEGWTNIPVTPQQLLSNLGRRPTTDDLRYAGKAIDFYLKPRNPDRYPD